MDGTVYNQSQKKKNNPYTVSRMEVAEMVKALGNNTAARKPEEMEVARRNEIRADERFQHEMGKMDEKYQESLGKKANVNPEADEQKNVEQGPEAEKIEGPAQDELVIQAGPKY